MFNKLKFLKIFSSAAVFTLIFSQSVWSMDDIEGRNSRVFSSSSQRPLGKLTFVYKDERVDECHKIRTKIDDTIQRNLPLKQLLDLSLANGDLAVVLEDSSHGVGYNKADRTIIINVSLDNEFSELYQSNLYVGEKHNLAHKVRKFAFSVGASLVQSESSINPWDYPNGEEYAKAIGGAEVDIQERIRPVCLYEFNKREVGSGVFYQLPAEEMRQAATSRNHPYFQDYVGDYNAHFWFNRMYYYAQYIYNQL